MTSAYHRSQGTTTSELANTSSSWTGRPIIDAVLIFICIFSFIANLAMLICLLVYKQAARKTVNIFVCNQTILDLFVTFFSAVLLALKMSGYLNNKTGVLRNFTRKLEITVILDVFSRPTCFCWFVVCSLLNVDLILSYICLCRWIKRRLYTNFVLI